MVISRGMNLNGNTAMWRNVMRLCVLAVLWAALLATTATAQVRAGMSDAVERHVRDSVCFITTHVSNKVEADTTLMGGWGCFINDSGLCVTTSSSVILVHRMDYYEREAVQYRMCGRYLYRVHFPSNTHDEGVVYYAQVIYVNEDADIALLHVYEDYEWTAPLQTPHYLHLRSGETIQPGMPVWMWGNPRGSEIGSYAQDTPLPDTINQSFSRVTEILRRDEGNIRLVGIDHWIPELRKSDSSKQQDYSLKRFQGYWSGEPVVDARGNLVGMASYWPPYERAVTLIPADLIGEMLSAASNRGKFRDGTDLEPAYSRITDVDGYCAKPYGSSFDRAEDVDTVYLGDGKSIQGDVTGESLAFTTPLGMLRIPSGRIAFLLPGTDSDRWIALLDGGQRFPFDSRALEIEVKLEDGQTQKVDVSSALAVAFRRGRPVPPRPVGRGYLLEGPDYRLYLDDPEGTAVFEVKGTDVGLPIPFERIRSIDSLASDQWVVCADGMQLAGRFRDEATCSARIPIGGERQAISLAQVSDVALYPVDFRHRLDFAIDIGSLLPDGAGEGLRRVAELIDAGRLTEAREMVRSDSEASAGGADGDRVHWRELLSGIIEWRLGEWAEAKKHLEVCRSAEDFVVRRYADAMLLILERWPSGRLDDGRGLSDCDVLQEASGTLAKGYSQQAMALLTSSEMNKLRPLVWHEEFLSREQFQCVREACYSARKLLKKASMLGDPEADWIRIQSLEEESGFYWLEQFRCKMELQDDENDLSESQRIALEEERERVLGWIVEVKKEIESLRCMNSDPDKKGKRILGVGEWSE